jgi:hypothetical protein
MQQNQASQERMRSLFINLTVVVVFVSLMLGFILYFEESKPNIKQVVLESLAIQYAGSVNTAHWQWQGEGRPAIILLVDYAPGLAQSNALVEKDRRPIFMSHLGWPQAQPSSQGCEKLWKMVLNTPLEIHGFRIFAEFYDGVKLSDNALDSTCRYRLSVGPYFEYQVYTGQVSKVTSK